MSIEFKPLNGDLIHQKDLRIPKAIALSQALPFIDYTELLECRLLNNPEKAEALLFEVEVEIGQKTINDIHRKERIAVIFKPSDENYPEALALREDFPKVPHLNLREYEFPRNLCLFDEQYGELKLWWTPNLFVSRIREWLSLTAKGILHQATQPLEPFLIPTPIYLIMPSELFSPPEGGINKRLVISRHQKDLKVLIADWEGDETSEKPVDKTNFPIFIQGSPQLHGVISKQPKTLEELHLFLLSADINLMARLKECFKEHKHENEFLNANMVLIVNLPKRRTELTIPETSDIWAFLIPETIKEIGVQIGMWEIFQGKPGTLLSRDDNQKGQNIPVVTLNPTPAFSEKLANKVSGIPQCRKRKFLLIGAGALGSQVLINLIRMGIGDWTILDDDDLLPHNLARHVLPGFHLGANKADGLAFLANNILEDHHVAVGRAFDVLAQSNSEEFQSICSDSEFIIDASTSLAVARMICRDINSHARRISIFLNPEGTDSILLAENRERNISIDLLEMQYYRLIIRNKELETHLERKNEQTRYARGCRDISSNIPQYSVALHAAICCKSLLDLISDADAARISIWRYFRDDLNVRHIPIDVYKKIEIRQGDWTVCLDEWLITQISDLRSSKLPNETGGILVGTYDMQRKIMYIVDFITSPPDSKEQPTIYIRGCRGLTKQIEKIGKITDGMVQYIGEWHSHPDGSDTEPSIDDIRVLHWLHDITFYEGQPALMLIVGEGHRYSILIE